MTRFYFAVAVLVTATCYAQTEKFSGEIRNATFTELVKAVEDQSAYRFYFKQFWVDSLTLNVNLEGKTITEIISAALAGTELQYSIDSHKNIYITKGRSIMTDLPIGFFPGVGAPQRQQQSFDFADYEREERKRKAEEAKLYNIGDKNTNQDGVATLAGTIRDASNGEPLIGATLFDEKTSRGVSTDQFGYYSLTMPKGRHDFHIKSIGMKATVRKVMLYSDGKLNIELDPDVTPLKEVVVESQHEARLTNVQMGTEKLDIQAMKQMPLALGETDVMKVVLALPGVQSVGEGTVGLNVRGGATNQNLILLNDAVVYNPSHLFGFFSTFNPDILKNVELYKSGIKAEYGGRLSSVLDVHTRDGSVKKIGGSGGISPITGRLTLEGPIINDKTSFIIGARSTYSNWILRQLNNPALQRSKASFYDVTGGITHKINEKNDLYFSGYKSNDEFRLNSDTTYSYSDRNASLKWKKIFNNKLVGVATGSFSNYTYRMESNKIPVNAFTMDFSIRQATVKAEISYFYNSKHTFDAGVSSTRYWLSPGEIRPFGADSKISDDKVQHENGLESAIYVSDNFEVSSKLSLYAGIRYSVYQYIGEKDVFVYGDAIQRVPSNTTDKIHYGKGDVITSYGGAEPRLALRYSLAQDVSVKASYNKMRQYIQMLSNTTAITPTDIWKLSDPYIRPQVGDQFSFGFYKNFTGKHLIETSIEAYYKVMHNTTDYKNGAVLLLNHQLETDVLSAKGEAYGIEFLVKKSAGKVNGWISYAYSRSFLTTKGTFLDETINSGKKYPSNFDKPHAFNFIGNYKLSRRFNVSLNTVYSTGRPITLPIAKYEVNGGYRILYSDRNAYRIPDYFRIDLSINIEGNHKIKKLAHSSWTVAVYNLTSRANAYSVYFTSKDGQIKGYKLSIFARAIPTITYNFKF